jgi:hypothetical protein
MAANNTVLIKGDPLNKEYVADGAITPGHLIQLDADGKIVVHGTAGGRAAKAFAKEDDLQGNSITDAYAAADPVQTLWCKPGDEINALIANGENIAIGDWLVSNGDGTLKEADTLSAALTEVVIAMALEAVDMSGSSGADPATARCKIVII